MTFKTKGKSLKELKEANIRFTHRHFGKIPVDSAPSFSKVKDKQQRTNLKKAWYSRQIKHIQKMQSIIRYNKKKRLRKR